MIPAWVPEALEPGVSALWPWLSAETALRAQASLHTLYFGSETEIVAMQDSLSFGPTVGMSWKKSHDFLSLGLAANAYTSFGTRAFFFGLAANAFAEFRLPKGFISTGLRYDFSVGSVRGVLVRDDGYNVTEEQLEELSVPGVALSFGGWVGYTYPIRKNLSLQARLGYRNDGKRHYFDSNWGAVFQYPF